tara:strand:- start:4684 stop:5091 length:408 start_codon:yes stop_codon:yes gene_type:complete
MKVKKRNKICSICLETVKRPALLQLNCDCKYYTHYKCFYEWWKIKSECIICHKKCDKPRKYNFKNTTPPKIKKRYKKLDRLVSSIENRQMMFPTNPEEYIENQIIPSIPCDNENELITCLVGIFVISFLYLIFYM